VIEIVEGLPDNVVGVIAKGRVTNRDLSEVLAPAIEKALDWHHRLRLYYEIRTRYPGAGWDEAGLGLVRSVPWERVAIVCDAAWIRHSVTALRLLISSDVRVFVTSQIPESLAWITGSAPGRRRPASIAARTVRSFQPPPQYLRHVP
jgi:hypothetical protein